MKRPRTHRDSIHRGIDRDQTFPDSSNSALSTYGSIKTILEKVLTVTHGFYEQPKQQKALGYCVRMKDEVKTYAHVYIKSRTLGHDYRHRFNFMFPVLAYANGGILYSNLWDTSNLKSG